MTAAFIVTTVYNPGQEIVIQANKWAETLNAPFIPRERHSLKTLMEKFTTDIVVLASQEGPVIHTPGGKYFFHLSMAELRIKNLVNGKHDHMIAAMGLVPGMSLLDCTLGLASDAIVASYVTGSTGKILGLESSPLLALVAEFGLNNFVADNPEVTSSLRRIKVKQADHFDYLSSLPDNSFDIVFFDPMFRNPVDSSSNLKPIRHLADSRPLTPETLLEARRIARRRVVIKEAQGSKVFRELGISVFAGGKYSSIQYGIVEVED